MIARTLGTEAVFAGLRCAESPVMVCSVYPSSIESHMYVIIISFWGPSSSKGFTSAESHEQKRLEKLQQQLDSVNFSEYTTLIEEVTFSIFQFDCHDDYSEVEDEEEHFVERKRRASSGAKSLMEQQQELMRV